MWLETDGSLCIASGKWRPSDQAGTCRPEPSCAERARGSPFRVGSLTAEERLALERLSAPSVYADYRADDRYRLGRESSRPGVRVVVALSSPPAKPFDPGLFYPVEVFSGVFIEGARDNHATTTELIGVLRGIERRHDQGRWCILRSP